MESDSRALLGKQMTLPGEIPVSCYVTGPQSDCDAVIIVTHDIFGPLSGRTREICDELASMMGPRTLVLLPYLFADGWPADKQVKDPEVGSGPNLDTIKFLLLFLLPRLFNTRWNGNVEPKFRLTLLPFARKALAKSKEGENTSLERIALCGFCWGGWCNLRACASFPSTFRAAVGFHPSPMLCW